MTFNPRAAILTILWLGLIYWLSSLPDLSRVEDAPILTILSNIAHAPLFAVLALCCLKTIGGPQPSPKAFVVVAVVTACYGALDEWHQSFVPGRFGSLVDVAVDIAGAWGLLFVYYLRTIHRHLPAKSRTGTARTWAN